MPYKKIFYTQSPDYIIEKLCHHADYLIPSCKPIFVIKGFEVVHINITERKGFSGFYPSLNFPDNAKIPWQMSQGI